MYFVDRNTIEEKLIFMEKQLEIMQKHNDWHTHIEKAALERLAHTVIESMIDIGNALIDGFIMRDPGSYEDIVDILLDEKVIIDEVAFALKKVISFRKMLVQQYESIDHAALLALFKGNMSVLFQFASNVRTYVVDELGPVSAFKN